MDHPTEGELQGLLDGELEPGETERVEAHLAQCGVCRSLLTELRQAAASFSRALLFLDSAASPSGRWQPPRISAGRPPSARGGVRRRRWGALARAAVLVFFAAGAASALAPGWPLHAWLEGLIGTEAGVEDLRPGGPDVTAPVAPSPAGISVAPIDGRVRVMLDGFAPESRVRLRVVDREEARVRVDGAHQAARFVVGPGRLEVIGSDGGEVRVELPRSAGEATVEIDGDLAVRVAQGRLQLHRSVADTLQEDVIIRVGEE